MCACVCVSVLVVSNVGPCVWLFGMNLPCAPTGICFKYVFAHVSLIFVNIANNFNGQMIHRQENERMHASTYMIMIICQRRGVVTGYAW